MERVPDSIAARLEGLPADPGVYLMKDAGGEVIYIGKASSLKKRVSSYFTRSDRDIKTAVLVKTISDIDIIVTASEIEALILENNLIKKHKPRFNIRLKDDKRYPYIAVTLGEDYPRVLLTRRMTDPGNRYFGPYTDAQAARRMMSLINSTFKLKTCTRKIPLRPGERPCLNYQMKRCHGQCLGEISREEYREIVAGAVKFLEGDVDPVLERLRGLMKGHAERMEYEKAARIRDVIDDIAKITEAQRMHLATVADHDYIGILAGRGEALALLFEFRRGIMLGRIIRVFDNVEYASPGEIARLFIVEHYGKAEAPARIITSVKVDDAALLEEYLESKACRKVALVQAKSQDDRAVLNLIARNLDVIAAERRSAGTAADRAKALEELAGALGLGGPPEVIECFDISNIQGTNAVASMVQFRGGVPERAQYRRYRIRGYEGANDPGMIHEAVSRRLQFCLNENAGLPDLLVIDGGRTQLARAREAAEALGAGVPIISLAKKFEEVYLDPDHDPLRLGEGSPGLKILQQVRDEAHRFAVGYHRNLRERGAVRSRLDEIPGVGEKKRRLLFRHFRSMERITAADLEELMKAPGIGEETARAVYAFFHGGDSDGNSG